MEIELNYFVKSDHKQSYSQFTNIFTARLHSEDDVMCRHHDFWKWLIGNFIIGLLSLGVALGVKLIASKVNTGRFSMFYDKTQQLQKIEALECVILNFAASAA